MKPNKKEQHFYKCSCGLKKVYVGHGSWQRAEDGLKKHLQRTKHPSLGCIRGGRF